MDDGMVIDLDVIPKKLEKKVAKEAPRPSAQPLPEYLSLSTTSAKPRAPFTPKEDGLECLSAVAYLPDFLDQLEKENVTSTNRMEFEESPQVPFPGRPFPRYHDYNVDEIHAKPVKKNQDRHPVSVPLQPKARVPLQERSVVGFEVSKIKVILHYPYQNPKLRGKSEWDSVASMSCIQFKIDRKDDGEVDVIKDDGKIKVPKTQHIIQANKKKPKKGPAKAITLVFRGFRFKYIEYYVLWLAGGIESELAVGIVRLSDVCGNLKMVKKDFYKPLPELDKFYRDRSMYKLAIQDSNYRSTIVFYGRPMVEWDEFLKKPIPVDKTSISLHADESESSEEEEEGEIVASYG